MKLLLKKSSGPANRPCSKEYLKSKKFERGRSIASKPNNTLVIMSMDGDSIGRWISGVNNPTVIESIHEDTIDDVRKSFDEVFLRMRRGQSPANHAFISRTLSTYALKQVREIIEGEYCGKVIYVGGDDIKALLPPEDAFEFRFGGHIQLCNRVHPPRNSE